MSNRAWVTLATNDSYGLGALVLAHSLRRAGSSYPAVVLITPSVTEAMRDRLRAVFAEVVIVDVLDSKDAAHLALLQRPELGITFTKIHCWNLIQYEKCVFLDADTLIVQNCDELFEREELSAAPDVGWPDCFNSGVFVFKPSSETFESIIKFAKERGSFDGGDQGLLNSYFSDWAQGDINKHLPFLYNVTSAAFYSYLPALKHYGQNLKIIHFIGAAKPWLQQFNWETRTSEAPQHLREFLQLWWDIYVSNVHSVLDTTMVELEKDLPAASPQETFFHTEPRLDYCHYEPKLDPESEFPWHHPDAQVPDSEANLPEIDMTQFHDPWDIYRGHIPPKTDDSSSHQMESQKSKDHDEMRKYAWDYVSPQQYQPDGGCSDMQNIWKPEHSENNQNEHTNQSHDTSVNMSEHQPQPNYYPEQQYSQNIFQEPHNYVDQPQSYIHYYKDNFNEHNYIQENIKQQSQNHFFPEHSQQDNQSHYTHNFTHNQNDYINEFGLQKDSEKSYYPDKHQRVEHVYYLHLDHKKVRDHRHSKCENDEAEVGCMMNGHGEADNEIFESLIPRHPYDGFYLRHKMTIDSRGRKVCTHEVPPTPTPSPPESPIPGEIFPESFEEEEFKFSNNIEEQTGVAGNFARMVLGAGAQPEALDDLTRRQGWEAGNIDYMGADAFDNIWAKISQTLNQPRSSPPKQSTPPPAQVPPPVEQAVAVAESPSVQAPVETPKEAPPAPVPESVPASIVTPTEEVVKVAPIEVKAPVAPEPEVEAPIPAAVVEPAKVVAAAPTKPEPAAEVSPVAAAVAPAQPAPIPPVTVEAKKEDAPAPQTPPADIPIIPADLPVAPADIPIPPADIPILPAAAPKSEVTPVKSVPASDSPPLANTPSKEDRPVVPAAKSEERRKPAGLQLPAAAADALPTPDSEQEDAASLAHAIIAGEMRTPAAPSPPPPLAPPPVSLSQIGVQPQPKLKSTTAAQIESSVTEAADPPKKKVVKKVLKKDGGEAPVPPPRKKEKKPKDK